METAIRRNGIVILIVEDDPDHRETLTVLLEQEGYDIHGAGDGLHAIERLRWGLRPNVILLDMRMHVMNGWEFLRELGRDPAYSATPVIVMSGGPLKPEDLAGCADWIAKPVTLDALLDKVKRHTRLPVPRTGTRLPWSPEGRRSSDGTGGTLRPIGN